MKLKWYLMPPCLTLSIIRHVSRVKWCNPGKGVASSPLHLGVVAIEKGAFRPPSTTVANFTDKLTTRKEKNKWGIFSWVGLDDTFKAENCIFSIGLRANGKFWWILRNFISREANVVLKIHKTLIKTRIEYCTQAWKLVLSVI